jgi:acetyltransferase-like isoleucine patch superfamily enzyme
MSGLKTSQMVWKITCRAYCIAMTLLWWKWRLFKLGPRTIIKRCLQINNPGSIAIGSRVTLMHQSILADLNPEYRQYPKIRIGDGCTILYRFQCNAAESVKIGNHVLIASNVLITDSDHVIEPEGIVVTKNKKLKTKPVEIGDGCWIGQNAVILKGVKIGSCCIIGANSVVTRDVPERTVVAGNPARIIKRLP